MALWTNQAVTVSMDAENVYLQIGPEGFSLDKDRVRAIAAKEIKTPEFLLAIIAIALGQTGVDMTKPAQIKSFVEGRFWPW